MTYLDTNIFIRAFLDLTEKGDKARDLISSILNNKRFSTSVLTYDELVWVIRKSVGVRESIQAGKNLLAITNFRFISIDKLVLSKTQQLIESTSLKPRDAVHAAAALLNGEIEIISDDADFDKIKELKRISLEKFKI
ncbi:type II toxin-antitoxin system VapC family toxin [Candidatus Woesearchaeota archaeon]|nr:type II toxin-antitoxin system VapC family toxin [Candidatus Woesearchaeota archaeon]